MASLPKAPTNSGSNSNSGRITKDTIDKVRDRVDIIEEIGRRLALKKSGATFVGLCPFHGEKTPSFHVSPIRQRFHCFGCGADGDAFEFLMQHDGQDFHEVVEDLASKVGIRIEREQAYDSLRPLSVRTNHQTYEDLTRICERAADFFRGNLDGHVQGYEYAQSRGLTPEIVDLYGIGYASGKADGLREVFPDYETNENLVKTGMVVRLEEGPNKGRRFDRFRERLMFPIRDTKGRIVGFGGRIVHGNNPRAAKYLNSPETELFSKHRVLYGLHEARAAIMRNKQAFVVEGYMDVVAMAMHGIPNAVAAMGTAMTQDHARLLLRFTRNICFLFDGDQAGQNAAWKSAQTVLPLMQPGISVSFLTLPDDQDPDEYLTSHGKQAFMGLVSQNAQSLTTFLLKKLMLTHGNNGRLDTLEAKANFAREAIELASQIPNENTLGILLRKEIETLSGVSTPEQIPTSGAALKSSTLFSAPPPGARTSARPWLPPDQYRAMREAQRAALGNATPGHETGPLRTLTAFNQHFKRSYTGTPSLPINTPSTLWQQLAQAIRHAPSHAFKHAGSITSLLNQEDPEEFDVLLILDALENSDAIEDPPDLPLDIQQAAIDLITHTPSLIRKHRRTAHIAHLKNLRDAGEISDEQYLAQVSKA